jgi:tRNA nucleotidyltransferase (CCA-adding enzyme)
MNIGIEKGPKMGIILNELLDMVVEDPTLNRKDILLEKATKLNKKN